MQRVKAGPSHIKVWVTSFPFIILLSEVSLMQGVLTQPICLFGDFYIVYRDSNVANRTVTMFQRWLLVCCFTVFSEKFFHK